MASQGRPQLDASTAPSARFLQARITALSTTLIKRFENILAVALDETDMNGQPVAPALTDTAMQQLQLEVDSTALVKAAEEIMMLTRNLKEIWLFGELNTIKSDEKRERMEREERELAEEERKVRWEMHEWLKGYSHVRAKEAATVGVEEDNG